jgi:hypothetical protein
MPADNGRVERGRAHRADSPHFFDDEPKPEVAKALFAVADLARGISTERWIDPRDGEAAYRTAGR